MAADREWIDEDPFYQPDTTEHQRFTQLPDGVPAEIAELTRQITDEWDTPYLKALALQNHLREFTYDEDARAGLSTNYLVQFLTKTRRGYCEQFAGAMAVMLRTLGIPARVVVGFTPGGFNPRDGLYHVTTRNAHAWVEISSRAYGWLPFEPTPSRSNPTQRSYLSPVQLNDGEPVPGSTPGTPAPDRRNEAGRQLDPGGLGSGPPPGGRRSRLRRSCGCCCWPRRGSRWSWP